MNVYIIDDEAYIRDSLSTLIDWEKLGFNRPILFADAESALDRIPYDNPFLIISDIKMPKMDGLEFCKSIHEKNKNINLFILSAYSEFSLAIKAMHFGVKRYFVKPISVSEIQDAIISLTTPKPKEMTAEHISDYVIKYIDSNISTATIKAVANELGISPNHLSILFHKETGKTFSEVLNEKKMALAVTLMEKGADKRAAAESIGYQDISSFKKALATYLKDKL